MGYSTNFRHIKMIEEEIIGDWAVGYRFSPSSLTFKVYVSFRWYNKFQDYIEVSKTAWGKGVGEFDKIEDARNFYEEIIIKLTDYDNLKNKFTN